MYNKEISIGSYKVRVIILLAIVVVFWVMFGHILCGCCRVSLFEGAGMGSVLDRLRDEVRIRSTYKKYI